MDKWGFSYVENLTWVHMAPNNTVVAAVFAVRAQIPPEPVHLQEVW